MSENIESLIEQDNWDGVQDYLHTHYHDMNLRPRSGRTSAALKSDIIVPVLYCRQLNGTALYHHSPIKDSGRFLLTHTRRP